MSENNELQSNSQQWLHPNEVLKIQRLKLKKKKLQARITKSNSYTSDSFEETIHKKVEAIKRKNPFIKSTNDKRLKPNSPNYEESSDDTLFKLFQLNDKSNTPTVKLPVSFSQIFHKEEESTDIIKPLEDSKPWIPIDWSLKTKLRLLSAVPFSWNQKLKVSEEASGITAFVRCLDNNTKTTLDTSSNAKFHQCCLYWEQPSLPWLNLFPRTNISNPNESNVVIHANARESLQRTWCDGLRSLFQLVRTRQCPYFYVCLSPYTVLFRAAGICGYSEINVVITPTTCGFRHLLKQKDIEYTMPLTINRNSSSNTLLDSNGHLEEEILDDQWFESLGINSEDIKQINFAQERRANKSDLQVDNSEESLVLIKGVEVNAFYNFLLNSKTIINQTGMFAGIPPTLLAPVAFHGATLSSLKVKESKVQIDGTNYFSVEIRGPILPQLLHNLCSSHLLNESFTAVFANYLSTMAFSKIKVIDECDKENENSSGFAVFDKENLADCGLNSKVLNHFCTFNSEYISNIESLKYNAETKTYTWS